MKVYITSNGCAVLKHETERIAKFFKLNFWERTTCVQDADMVVMTCCGVTHNEENQGIDANRLSSSLEAVYLHLPKDVFWKFLQMPYC